MSVASFLNSLEIPFFLRSSFLWHIDKCLCTPQIVNNTYQMAMPIKRLTWAHGLQLQLHFCWGFPLFWRLLCIWFWPCLWLFGLGFRFRFAARCFPSASDVQILEPFWGDHRIPTSAPAPVLGRPVPHPLCTSPPYLQPYPFMQGARQPCFVNVIDNNHWQSPQPQMVMFMAPKRTPSARVRCHYHPPRVSVKFKKGQRYLSGKSMVAKTKQNR